MSYEAWRITYQSSEQAAKAAYSQIIELSKTVSELETALTALVNRDLTCMDRQIVAGIEVDDVLKARALLGKVKAGKEK